VTGQVERHIRRWLREFVVGLNLCPFARPLLDAPNLRIAVCEETDHPALLRAFLGELDLLQRSAQEDIATTLLAFPRAVQDFEVYLYLLEDAEGLLLESGLEGVVQLASFHPQYQFAGEAPGAASQYSNRAPYPIIHLLREDMLSRVLADDANAAAIPVRNIAALTALGEAELQRRWLALFSDCSP
jgi:uncharacterized protein